MSTNTEQQSTSPLDILKWIVVVALIGGLAAGNAYFSGESVLYRALAAVAVFVVAGFVALQTVKGRAFADLIREARGELRRVVWPTRPEATQTTLIVIGVTLVMALLMWGLDSLIGWGVSSVIG